MKTNILIYGLLFMWFATGCDNSMEDELCADPPDTTGTNAGDNPVPEGYFAVQFMPSAFSETRAPVTVPDSRVQHIRYIVYKSTGEYVKEKVILSTSSPVTWPLPMVSDTLPYGSYQAVFLGNIEKTLFPYETSGGPGNYSDVLLDYQTSYGDARISIPPAEFSDNTEYYWANVEFSDADPNPSVLLQRIIGSVQMKRVFIDAEDALNGLLANIVAQVNEGDLIQNTVDGILPGLIEDALNTALGPIITDLEAVSDPLNLLEGLIDAVAGLLDSLLNPLVDGLVGPIVTALNDLLLEELVKQLGVALTGNADKDGLITYLGVLLNPWNNADARYAVVSVENYPKSIDFDLNPVDIYSSAQLRYSFNTTDISQERHISLKTFAGSYQVNQIDIVGAGLVSGLVVDGAIDEFLLTGMLVNVDDPLAVNGTGSNRRYESSYAFLGLGTQNSSDVTEQLVLELRIGDIANIDGILGGILEPLLGGVLGLIGTVVGLLPVVGDILDGLEDSLISAIEELTIRVELPLNVSLLDINNLRVSGGWSPISPI